MPSQDYLYSTIYSSADALVVPADTTYYYGYSPEERSRIVDVLAARQGRGAAFVRLQPLADGRMKDIESEQFYELRDSTAIGALLRAYSCRTVYIDCSGLETRICAPLLRCSVELLKAGVIKEIRTVYTEPAFYRIRQFSTEGVVHDLAERIDGICPLPGFASIMPADIEDVCFIPLLGFEGGRFTHLLESVQPPSDNIVPVIGVPGFRVEYPFVAYWGNRQPLLNTDAWRNIRYAAANSLVDAFRQLLKIRRDRPGDYLKIAPIGTKPHAIAAILFAIKCPERTELVYDNPKREKQRTDGIGRIIDTDVGRLLREMSL